MTECYYTSSVPHAQTSKFQVDRVVTTLQPAGQRYARAVVRHPGGACIVPVLGDEVICVEQYRPALMRTVIEVPGGRMQHGESPEAAAVRELREEAGYTTETLSLLTVCHAVPDFSDWKTYIYLSVDIRPVVVPPLASELPIRVCRIP
jgi:ADP-ribose pyrophosphatase